MSSAYRCDRCGSYYMKNDPAGRATRPVVGALDRLPLYAIFLNGSNVDKIDLCPDCANKLYSWITEVEHERNEEHD